MEEASLLSLPEGMHVEHIQITEHGLAIEIEASHPTSCCPLCAQPSDSIKTHYRRILRDAPCAGRQVQLVLTVRKFYCRNPYCSRKVFDSAASNLCGAVGQNDDPLLPTDYGYWAGHLRQRRSPTRCSPGDTNHTPDDLAPHYGFASCFWGLSRLSGHRRFRLSTWVSVWHDPGQPVSSSLCQEAIFPLRFGF